MKGGKHIAIGVRPAENPQAEAWVWQSDGADMCKVDLFTARLTIDVTSALRARIKVAAFTQGIPVAKAFCGLLELEFPELQT